MDLFQPSILQDHAILQRGVPSTFGGRGTPGREVTVEVAGISAAARVDEAGNWSATLSPLEAIEETTVTIDAGERLVFRRVAIGDLWFCSGQSNMRFALESASGGTEAIGAARDPLLREFRAVEWASVSPSAAAQGEWRILEGEAAKLSSAIGFFFGKRLRGELGVPIGIINSASGGTPISSWLSREALLSQKGATTDYDRWWERARSIENLEASFPSLHREWKEEMSRYNREQVESFLKEQAAARAAGRIPPMPPPLPRLEGIGSKRSPNVLYNAMVAPFVRVPIKGVLWYQGESDAWSEWDGFRYRSRNYSRLLETLIGSWRCAWDAPALPFFVVQLANYRGRRDGTLDTGWPLVREAQARAAELPEVFLVPATDLGLSYEIHPPDKRPVAERLAASALRHVYGFSLDCEAPSFREAVFEGNRGNRVRIRVESQGPLAVRNGADAGPLDGFTAAGKDRSFSRAEASLAGHEILVTGGEGMEIAAVRYNWDDDPKGNLVGSNGLPLLPFRTDDWEE